MDQRIRIEKKIITSYEEFCHFKELWNKLEIGFDMTVYQSFNWNLLLYREWDNETFGKYFSKVMIYCVYDNDIIQILLPLILQKHTTKTRWFGRSKGIYILGHGSYSDYLNAIYYEFNELLFDLLFGKIHMDYPNLKLYISNILEYAALNRYFKVKGIHPIHQTVAVSVKRSESMDTYNSFLSKHTRQNLRTSLNRMKKDNIEYSMEIKGAIDDKFLLNSLLKIHILRMKTKNTSNIDLVHKISSLIRIKLREYKEKHNNIIYDSMQSMENSCLVLVYLNSVVVGYLYGLWDGDTVRFMQNCFDNEYKFYSPLFRGAYDFIIKTYENDKTSAVDFTRGEEEYKYKLGGVETRLYEYHVRGEMAT